MLNYLLGIVNKRVMGVFRQMVAFALRSNAARFVSFFGIAKGNVALLVFGFGESVCAEDII
ncbi:MAG: hypothetical protein ABFD79_16000 [Phycisphaerales bacterium]